ncbi:MAG: hypothetical protein QXL43_02275 [Methanolinea sp.]
MPLLPATFLLAGLVIAAGCTNTPVSGPAERNPFVGTWQHFGVIGTEKVAMRFVFLENGTGQFDLVAPSLDPPYATSMAFSWESRNDRLWIGSSAEREHLDVRYNASADTLEVTADSESGIFVGSDFVPGPFRWEFSRASGTGVP